uniref:Uncharacterized protein n=1 Tax=Glossina palpalis gambiensis TaxID=67801 RepID=A0A1B0BDT9_9MUSC
MAKKFHIPTLTLRCTQAFDCLASSEEPLDFSAIASILAINDPKRDSIDSTFSACSIADLVLSCRTASTIFVCWIYANVQWPRFRAPLHNNLKSLVLGYQVSRKHQAIIRPEYLVRRRLEQWLHPTKVCSILHHSEWPIANDEGLFWFSCCLELHCQLIPELRLPNTP